MLPSTHHKPTPWTSALVVILLVAGVSVVPILAGASLGQQTTPTPQDQTGPVPLYGLWELGFSLPRIYSSPYDPDQISIMASFDPPQGESMTVPGFYMRPYSDLCVENCASENLAPIRSGEWHVRFTPNQVGTWRYSITVQDTAGARTFRQGSFEVAPSNNPGYIRVSGNGRYFSFDSGSAYFPVGENLAWSWPGGGGIYSYERWLDQLRAVGANYARLNVDVPWFIGLDWSDPAGDYTDAQAAAWRFDTILQMAEERGIYLQVVLIWHQSFAMYTDPPESAPPDVPRPDMDADWTDNPYNVANGGPLAMSSDVFTDETAQDLLHQRLRYIVARWGYSPHIFAWEVVDELDGILGYTPGSAQPWLQAMSGYLREIDPYDHLITAGTRQLEPAIWEMLDFAQVRCYQETLSEGTVDQVADTLTALSEASAYARKPVLLTEFSLNRWHEPATDDPTGVHIHNTIWATALSGAAGGGMTWWWDTYVDQQNLYTLFTPLALFSRDIPWSTANLQPVAVGLVADNPLAYGALRVEDFNRDFPGQSPPDTIYRLTADGAVPPTNQMSAYLYGQFNPERSRPQTFIISPPVDTELRIHVQNVSSTAPAVLAINMDGVEAARVDFSPDSQNILVTVPISAGEHTVILDNLGQDWLQLSYIEVAQYRTPVRALALADRSMGIAAAWVQHRDYTWQLVASAGTLEPLNFALNIPDMPPGTYRVTYWNTTTGSVIGEENVTLAEDNPKGTLSLRLLPITSQLAVSAFRVAGPAIAPTAETTQLVTRTPQVSMTPTATETSTPTETLTPAPSSTGTPTSTLTATPTSTDTPVPTDTPTETPSPTITPTPTATHTPQPSDTPTPTQTPSPTPTPLVTPIPSPTKPLQDGIGGNERPAE